MSAHLFFLVGLGGFLGGVLGASFFMLPAWLGWALLIGGFLCCLFRQSLLLVVGCLVLTSVLGFWRTNHVLARPSALWDMAAKNPVVSIAGFVDGDFELTASGRGKWVFRVMPENERIIVYAQDTVRPRYGQEYLLTGKLTQPKNNTDFDYISYLAKDGIYAQMSFPAYAVPAVPLHLPNSTRFWIFLNRSVRSVRDTLADSLQRAVPAPESGYLAGILFGLRSDISPALANAFSRTGTSHIMAISGYNITIIATALAAGLAFLGRRRAYLCTVAGILAFTLMVGAGPSVVRAAIMGLLALTAVQLGRQQSSLTAILFAAAGMTAYNPLWLRWDVGFQLSFLALIGIVYLEPILKPFLIRMVRWKPLATMAATTIAAQMMVLPLILYDFGQLAVYTLPVNLIILPMVSLAMVLGFSVAVLGVVWPFAGSLIGQIAWLVSAIQLGVVRFASALPHAALEIRISTAALLGAYVGIASWLFLQYRRQTKTTYV